MKREYKKGLAGLCLALVVPGVPASVRYVSQNNAGAAAPYLDWSTAAANIQDAVDASVDGDLILVSNGVYAAGGRVMAGDLTNRVVIDRAITVQSLNGPWTTVIQGAPTNGIGAVRCAWLTNGASLVGFTLTRGATRVLGDTPTLQSGGGVWCASTNAIVANCAIVSNSASAYGGGAYRGTILNCWISSNGVSSSWGSGVYGANLGNCTVVSNSASALTAVQATNCIVYFNGANFATLGYLSYCCTIPAPGSSQGSANFTNTPQLFADGMHLVSGSPCIAAGTNLATGTDIFGRSWASPPSVGCAEWDPATLVLKPQIRLTSDPVGFTVTVTSISGQAPWSLLWLKDGIPLSDNGHFTGTQSTNLAAMGVTFADAGNYQLVVTNMLGAVTSAAAPLVIHCVDVAGTNPVVPFSDWSTAATNIQDAIGAAAAGDVVLVTNGLYASGGKSMDGTLTNRVSLDKAVLVQSVNGPGSTTIQGAWDPVTTNGPAAIRCVWLTNNAIVSGFRICGGATRAFSYSSTPYQNGGGIWGITNSGFACNCIIETNCAANTGGGAYRVVLKSCVVTGNRSIGSGIGTGTGNGGGAESGKLVNCLVMGNSANSYGGGAENCQSITCVFTGNKSLMSGSAANQGTLVNCTVTGNTVGGDGTYGGAVANAILTNCVVYANLAVGSAPSNYSSCTFSYSDTAPLPAGTGNISSDPQLLADNIHVAAASPCLGAGRSLGLGTDIDGQSWSNPPAIGCDEWHPEPAVSLSPVFRVNSPVGGLTFDTIIAGQPPYACAWSKDGVTIQDDGHYSNTGAANLVINRFGPADAGIYQVIASNSFGAVTSAPVQLVIHTVNIMGGNPVTPFTSWATAATNIQDAIDTAGIRDIILVTNGVYGTGGKVVVDGMTNRVVLDRPVTVTSVNGFSTTAIEGAWDSVSTNGPGAVRCAWIGDGAALFGFTLRHGATRTSGYSVSLQGGGAWGASTNSVISNCVISNNYGFQGGGLAFVQANNCLVMQNNATLGGGAYAATLNNCVVKGNYCSGWRQGGGTYNCIVENSILLGNYIGPSSLTEDNYEVGSMFISKISYSCTYPLQSGVGNFDGYQQDPQFLDLFHVALTSPCVGTGGASYAIGADLDGQTWSNPPAIGCDQVLLSDLVGPLSVHWRKASTNVLVNRSGYYACDIDGRATRIAWSFGSDVVVTNMGNTLYYRWSIPGDYVVTATAYNLDCPAGVTTSTAVHVESLHAPELVLTSFSTNGFQFQFTGQTNVTSTVQYTIQYATNLAAPDWQTLQTIFDYSGVVHQITDSAAPDATRFYRVLVQ